MLEKIKSVKETVKGMLTEVEELRDSDDKLIASIWYNEAVVNNPKLSALDLLSFLGQGKLTNSEAIRRARQKIQEQEPSLRGNNYKGRMNEEEVVRSGINEV
jgi:hypothetical protein